MQKIALAVLALTLAACASIGRPEGGERDKEPPVFVSSNPATGARNVSRQRIDLYFNENVQLDDAFNKVVVSPVQKKNARVSANGKHIIVELNDTLLPNTTYTIDFADAIKDLNEGNILDGFTTYFSTGDSIDSLRISGMVLEARTLEPAQGMLVGVYSNLADSAISTLPLERIARTNQLGQFTIHNLKPGEYRIFALNDVNRDHHWDRSENIAFYDLTISPSTRTITVTDTLRSSASQDSLVQRQGVAYLPNDVLLCWFNEGYAAQYLKDYKRLDRRRIYLKMAAPADSLPRISIASGKHAGREISSFARLQANNTLDSLFYWIEDKEILAIDSLMLSVDYRRTDSVGLGWRTDTLKFFHKEPKKKEKKNKDNEEEEKPETTFMQLTMKTNRAQDVNRDLVFTFSQPVASVDTAAFRLQMKKDTLWVDLPPVTLIADSLDTLLTRHIAAKWEPGQSYKLTVDSAAVNGIYDEHNNKFVHEFTVRQLEEYSNLKFNITGVDTCAFVELLDKSDKVIATAPVVNGVASFPFQNPGTVYARLVIDSNCNGKWDTGNLADKLQPEEVYYFPKKIVLKKNWDVDQAWNIYETPLDMQKPYDIKKNKPKLKKGEQRPVEEDEEDEEDNIFGDYNTYSNSRRNNRQGNQASPNRRQQMGNPLNQIRR